MSKAPAPRKPRQRKPHPLASLMKEPCSNCGSEWSRPVYDPDTHDFGSACANPWCRSIAQLKQIALTARARYAKLRNLCFDEFEVVQDLRCLSPEAFDASLDGIIAAEANRNENEMPRGEGTRGTLETL